MWIPTSWNTEHERQRKNQRPLLKTGPADMAKDFNGLAKRMSELSKTVERNAPLVVSLVARNIAPVLVYSTPVDTSRARLNWQAGIGSIPDSVLYAKPDKPPSPGYGGATAVAAIIATARTYAGGSYIAIANNAPYIQKLNQGSSAQAPALFVQQAIMVGIRSLNGFRILRDVN